MCSKCFETTFHRVWNTFDKIYLISTFTILFNHQKSFPTHHFHLHLPQTRNLPLLLLLFQHMYQDLSLGNIFWQLKLKVFNTKWEKYCIYPPMLSLWNILSLTIASSVKVSLEDILQPFSRSSHLQRMTLTASLVQKFHMIPIPFPYSILQVSLNL